MYTKHYNTKKTPQSRPISGRENDMTENSAGGFSFKVSDWDRLERFLILGTEGGSYYASEQKLTVDSANAVVKLIGENGMRVVKTVRDISFSGRAPKNDAAVFVLALCSALGDEDTKALSFHVLPEVARIGTHLFQYVDAVNGMRGWGRALKRAVSEWYTTKDSDRLAYQLVKYQKRGNWRHSDVLRLAKPKGVVGLHRSAIRWSVGKTPEGDLPKIIQGFEAAKVAENAKEIIKLIGEYGLTREMIPTQYMSDPSVYEALLYGMPLGAMVRNLGNMSKIGLLTANSEAARMVRSKLSDVAMIKKSMLHPVSVLTAMKVYGSGKSIKGNGVWDPVSTVLDALEETFYLAFGNIEPTGKNWGLFLDVSGSMGASCSAIPVLSCREASAAMSMVTARTEEDFIIKGFTSSGGWKYSGRGRFGGTCIQDLDIGARTALNDAVQHVSRLPFGGTDCAAPMVWAMETKTPIDVFVVYTDAETWAGDIQPTQALQNYRQKMGIAAKLVVVGMVGNEFTIADPDDSGMLDVVGFDSSAPAVMANFGRGKVIIDG